MGREQRRKEAKKVRNNKIARDINNDDMFKASTILKIVFAVIIILLVLYYILAVFVTKEIDVSGNKDSSSNEMDSSYSVSNKILATNTFRQVDQVYYVYYYDFDEENEDIASLVNNLTDYKVYRVDTGSSLNSNYVTEDESNKDVTDISNLKVKNPTIIKIDNDKVVEYHEGVDDITSFLSE